MERIAYAPLGRKKPAYWENWKQKALSGTPERGKECAPWRDWRDGTKSLRTM